MGLVFRLTLTQPSIRGMSITRILGRGFIVYPDWLRPAPQHTHTQTQNSARDSDMRGRKHSPQIHQHWSFRLTHRKHFQSPILVSRLFLVAVGLRRKSRNASKKDTHNVWCDGRRRQMGGKPGNSDVGGSVENGFLLVNLRPSQDRSVHSPPFKLCGGIKPKPHRAPTARQPTWTGGEGPGAPCRGRGGGGRRGNRGRCCCRRPCRSRGFGPPRPRRRGAGPPGGEGGEVRLSSVGQLLCAWLPSFQLRSLCRRCQRVSGWENGMHHEQATKKHHCGTIWGN